MKDKNKDWKEQVKDVVEVLDISEGTEKKEEEVEKTPNKEEVEAKEVEVAQEGNSNKEQKESEISAKGENDTTSVKPEEQQETKEENKSEESEESEEKEVSLTLDDELENEGITLHDKLDDSKQAKVEVLAQEVKDRHSIIFFGSRAQEAINRVSESMLEGVKSKDLGYAGENLTKLVTTLKGFDIDELDPTKKQGFLSKIFGFASPVEKFLAKYDDVRVQIDKIVDDLEDKKSKLLVDVTSLERLYKANMEFIKDLDDYIAAGAYKVKELNSELLSLESDAKGNKKLEKRLGIRDKRALITALEARVHDLKLSRMVALQSLPSIRLIQDNNKTLVEKINSTMVNTLPLWKNQLAQAVTIFRSKKASESIKAAQDFTNELLEENAKKLKEATKEITEQANRGVFDIESIKKANKTLIDSINESLDITYKAKKARKEAEIELVKIEDQLKNALVAAEKRKIKA